MFAIVEWTDSERQVSVVPVLWLTTDSSGKLLCYWPEGAFSDAIIKKQKPPSEKWPTYPVRLLRSEDSYGKALAKCKVALYSSDLSTSEAEVGKRSRHDRCRKNYSSSDVDEARLNKRSRVSLFSGEVPSVPSELMANSLKGNLPRSSPVSSYTVNPSILDTPCAVGTSNVSIAHLVTPVAATATDSTQLYRVTEHAESIASCNIELATITASRARDNNTSNIIELYSVPPHTSSVVELQPVTPHTGNCTASCSQVLHSVSQPTANNSLENLAAAVTVLLRQNEDIKQQLMLNTRLIQEMLKKSKVQDLTATGKLPENVSLPLNSKEEVQQLEVQLQNADTYKQLVNHLSLIGGMTTKECTFRIMGALLENSCARKFNWIGKSRLKCGFCSLTLRSVVTESVRKNPLTAKASNAEIESCIKRWLRNAPDRLGGRTERLKKMLRKNRRQQLDDNNSDVESPDNETVQQ